MWNDGELGVIAPFSFMNKADLILNFDDDYKRCLQRVPSMNPLRGIIRLVKRAI